ncbi:uncharacterized protein zbbx isoform X2 [Acanthopagrus latus]|uniref:uncharacterized protein zbbx isoform X2 n=1 Tax=Acanthopagrus latus TaxID=8177 RepID=UPI00187C6703|nr:uncharacterized protein zbbx isoform X2 [Acanthopagrus latus]
MNSNDFVVLPNNKAKSVKLKARNMQELQLKTVTLGQERQEMEEKLQQLKESMSKEKEERGYSGWKSGQCDSLIGNALTNSTKKSKEIMLQKLSAGKVKIRVLKDEPLTAPPQPLPPPPAIGSRATRKNRLRGRYCGQCEVKTAGLTDLQTHVSTRDVVSCVQKQIDPSSHPSNFTSSSSSPKPSLSHTIKSSATTRQGHGRPEEGTETVAKPLQLSPDHSQVLAVNQVKEKKVEMTEEGRNRGDERGVPTDLFSGEYNEEDSARSFQEALRQWRGQKSDEARDPMSEEAMWIPVRPVSAMATQADLASDRSAERRGRGGGEGRVPVRVEFTENSLTYLDRLLLKKHRRTPIKMYHPPSAFGADLKSLPNKNTEEDTVSSLTAQEEDFRRYCASLFAVPVSSGRAEPEITTPESCLTIEVLDETDRDVDGDDVVEQRTDNNIKVPSIQEVHSQVRTPVPQMALTSGVSSRVIRSSPSPIQTSRKSRSPAQPNAAQKLHLSKTTGAEHSMKSSSSKSKPSARPTAETPRTSKTLIKTPTSTSQKPNCPPTVHKSKPDQRSTRFLSPSLPHIQTEIPKSSHAPLSIPSDVSSLVGARPPSPEQHLSLRSTFTLSPSGSTESIFLPKVDQSNPFHKGSDSSLLPEQAQTSQLFPEPISSPKLLQSPPSNLESSRKSQHRPCDPDSLLSDNQLQPPPSPVSSSPNPPRKYPRPLKSLFRASLFNDCLPDAYSRQSSTPTNENALDQESTLSLQYAQCNPSLPSDVLHSPHSAVKMEEEEEEEEEEELSIDCGDEMSSDSLGVASHEEDSSDEGHSTRGRPRDEEQENSDIHAEGKKDFQSDEKEQLSEPLMVMHKQSAGSGSELFSDLDVFLPLGLDVNCGHSDTPKHTHWDSHQTSSYDSEPKESHGYWPSSSLSSYTEEHLVYEMLKNNTTQSTGIQSHSATPTRRREITANGPGTSGSGSNQSTPTASESPATCRLSHPISCSELGTVLRPLSRAAQEIMEICSVDQTGCEDPDLEMDTTAHTLYKLEEELRLISKETGRQTPVFGAGNSRSQYQHGNHHFTRGRDSEEQKEEDEAVQRDQQSVLLLP